MNFLIILFASFCGFYLGYLFGKIIEEFLKMIF